MTACVLDASAVLALLHDEPGAGRVADAVRDGAGLPTVNLAEVVGKLSDHGVDVAALPEDLHQLGIDVIPVATEDALLQVRVRRSDRAAWPQGAPLSLVDRLCLAIGMRLGAPVLTPDHAWADLDLPVEVELLR